MTINVPQSVYDELAEIMERMGKFQKKLRNEQFDKFSVTVDYNS